MNASPLSKRRWTNTKREALTFYLLVAPWIIGFVSFVLVPMLVSLFYSFNIVDLLKSPKWYGLGNYKYAFEDKLFYQSLKVTALYAAVSVPLNLVCALLLALMLHNITRLKRVFRTIYYIPAVIGGVPVMILWMFLFSPDLGLINSLLDIIGIKGPAWLYSEKWALPAMILMGVWGVGGGMIIWLAGLNNIPKYLYEVAQVDGASGFRQFFAITLPMLTPTIFFNLITGVIGAFQTFNASYVMTGGGPNNATLFYNLYLWRKAFSHYDMGYASALAWILFVIILALSVLILRSSSAWVYYEGGKE